MLEKRLGLTVDDVSNGQDACRLVHESIITTAKKFTNAESVSLYTYDPKKVLLRGVCSTDERKGAILPLPATVAGDAFRSGKVTKIDCLNEQSSQSGDDDHSLSSEDSVKQRQASRLCVPVLDGQGKFLSSTQCFFAPDKPHSVFSAYFFLRVS